MRQNMKPMLRQPCADESGIVTNNDFLYPLAFCSHGMKVRRKVDLLKHKQTA